MRDASVAGKRPAPGTDAVHAYLRWRGQRTAAGGTVGLAAAVHQR